MASAVNCDFLASLAPHTFYAPSSPADTSGLTNLRNSILSDTNSWQSLAEIAYFFATIKWETAHTFQPIHELGSLSYFDKYEPGTTLGTELGNTQPGDGFLFRGRGYVQITGRANYQHIGSMLQIDLAANPDLALQPEIAYKIAAGGMHGGWFTGRRLSQYMASNNPDFVNARRIINGLDHAADIAAYAQTFLVMMTATTLPVNLAAALPTVAAAITNRTNGAPQGPQVPAGT